MISLQKSIEEDIKRYTKKPLKKLSIQEILELIICEESICYIEGNYGAMAMGAKMKLQVLCNELNKRGFNEESINDKLKQIRKIIKLSKKEFILKSFKKKK
jgi:hypothetical protein